MVAIKPPQPIALLAAKGSAPLDGSPTRQYLTGLRFRCLVASLILHELAMLACAWLVIAPRHRELVELPMTLSATTPEPPVMMIEPPELKLQDPLGLALEPAIQTVDSLVENAPKIPAPQAGAAWNPPTPPQPESTTTVAPPVNLLITVASPGGGLEGRRADARAKLVAERGGSPVSEQAVELGLVWIVAHQHADGGWRFDFKSGPCEGRCRHSGREASTTAATALALLPLLGAGHTPREGEHAEAVAKGLAYLQSKMIVTPKGGDVQEGSMYGQGLAAIALAEAAGLTGDEELKKTAQLALDFIVQAQHVRGGWRYFPGQPGDTTVVGWQWMALKSGQLAGLSVPPETLTRAGEFLDEVQADDGAAYGYQLRDAKPTPTAIGLLCRMYSGWRRGDPRLARGVERLSTWGPSYDDMYFNYYATQVLHHYEGPAWPVWNERMQDRLVTTQADDGHEAGSWQFSDMHTASGGRLCDTALALMILEVYYRYLPLYGWQSVEF